jgi:hypothetical protein
MIDRIMPGQTGARAPSALALASSGETPTASCLLPELGAPVVGVPPLAGGEPVIYPANRASAHAGYRRMAHRAVPVLHELDRLARRGLRKPGSS